MPEGRLGTHQSPELFLNSLVRAWFGRLYYFMHAAPDAAVESFPIYIYHLVDRKGRVRYVGKTVDPLARYRNHLNCTSHRSVVAKWVTRSVRKGYVPKMVVVGVTTESDWATAENGEIASQRAKGARLLNSHLESHPEPKRKYTTNPLQRAKLADPIWRERKLEQIWHVHMNSRIGCSDAEVLQIEVGIINQRPEKVEEFISAVARIAKDMLGSAVTYKMVHTERQRRAALFAAILQGKS